MYTLLTLPTPNVFVGVFTEIKIKSASWIDSSMLVEKNKFTFLRFFTISSSPGYIKNYYEYKYEKCKHNLIF